MAHFTLVAPRNSAFTKIPVRPSVGPKARSRRGVFRRLLDAVTQSRQRQADREIARFLQARGGRLTDAVEREIERRFLSRSSGSF